MVGGELATGGVARHALPWIMYSVYPILRLNMSTVPTSRVTPEEYLAIERKSEIRHEYFDGEMFAMSGASFEHNTISMSLVGLLLATARARKCSLLSESMRVKISATGLCTYPDMLLTCDKPNFEDGHFDTLLNPQLIIEILSPSTESYDRGTKFRHYRSIPTLREYLLVSQDAPRIDRFALDVEGQWVLSDADGLDADIEIGVLDMKISLADVYATVEFDRQSDAKPT